MLYNIYKHIDERGFRELEARIASIAADCISLMDSHHFKLNKESLGSDSLGLDFLYTDDNYYGNIGFRFDDVDSNHTFTFYALKTKDEKDKRYYKRIYVYPRVTMEEIERDYKNMLSKCLRVYNNFRDADLTDFVILKAIPE